MENNLKLLGDRILSVSANRTENYDGKISLNTNLKLTNMEVANDDDNAMKVSYTFIIDYSDLGKIEISGYIFVGGNSDQIKGLLDKWEKKEFDSPEHAGITNLIIQKTSIRALQLEEELGLPIHMRLPTVTLNSDSE